MIVKKLTIIFLALLMICSLTACNYSGYDFVDNNYHFDYAYIFLPDGNTISGKIKAWADSEDGEQLTITFTNGDRYLVSANNCVLVESDLDIDNALKGE